MQRSHSANSGANGSSLTPSGRGPALAGGRPPMSPALPGGSPMATRRAPSPSLPRASSFGAGSSFGAAAYGVEDTLDAEVRRMSSQLPAASSRPPSGGGGVQPRASGASQQYRGAYSPMYGGVRAAEVLAVDATGSRPATGASGVGPQQGSSTPQYGRRSGSAGGGGGFKAAADPLGLSLGGTSMDGDSTFVVPAPRPSGGSQAR